MTVVILGLFSWLLSSLTCSEFQSHRSCIVCHVSVVKSSSPSDVSLQTSVSLVIYLWASLDLFCCLGIISSWFTCLFFFFSFSFSCVVFPTSTSALMCGFAGAPRTLFYCGWQFARVGLHVQLTGLGWLFAPVGLLVQLVVLSAARACRPVVLLCCLFSGLACYGLYSVSAPSGRLFR